MNKHLKINPIYDTILIKIGGDKMTATREIIAENISALRKNAKLTQAELAEKLNYSDKAISKWERGDSVPDVLVLAELAELFSVTVDYFLHTHTVDEKKPAIEAKKKRLRMTITMTSCIATYFVAAVIYFILDSLYSEIGGLWRVFLAPIPVVAILAIVFSAIWFRHKIVLAASVSALIWSITLLLFIFLRTLVEAWFLFIIAVPLQLITVFWFFFYKK